VLGSDPVDPASALGSLEGAAAEGVCFTGLFAGVVVSFAGELGVGLGWGGSDSIGAGDVVAGTEVDLGDLGTAIEVCTSALGGSQIPFTYPIWHALGEAAPNSLTIIEKVEGKLRAGANGVARVLIVAQIDSSNQHSD